MTKRRKANEKKEIQKKNKNIKIVDSGGLDSDVWSKIITVIVVLVVLGLFYLLTLYITGKNTNNNSNGNDNSSTEASISYDNILLGNSFSMSDEDYLVIYYDKSNEDISSTYSEMVSNYSSKEGSLNIYSVDMSSAFNKGKSTDGESNRNPQNSSELAIHGPTLIHFSNHSVSEYFEGEEDISNYLK